MQIQTLPRPSIDLAAVPSSRNRAVDGYRAFAMCAVAIGHWLAASVSLDATGKLTGENGLGKMAGLHWITWLFQVMPLFFCLGGFSNAASLDAHQRSNGRSADWVAARLRRLTQPAVWLAGVWLTILGLSVVSGIGTSIVGAAISVAAIPLWFLANYVVDTALAPTTLRLHRRHGARFTGALVTAFLAIEAFRLAGLPLLPQANIVLGWMLFQVLGFWWRDGLLPSATHLVALGCAAFVASAGMVFFGPWPIAMVSVPGADFVNTWPPSAALLAFGLGYCAFAIAAASRVSRFLETHAGAWKTVAIANTFAMTVYLWHFTAITVAGGLFYAIGWLPTAEVGTGAWFVQKLPMMVGATIVLAGIIAVLGGKERAGLFSSETFAPASPKSIGCTAVAIAGGFELWTIAQGNVAVAVAGMLLLLAGRRACTVRG